jgi:hypothetical protein
MDIHKITKEQLVELIKSSTSLNKLTKDLNTNRKELYRKRSLFGILDVKPNQKVYEDSKYQPSVIIKNTHEIIKEINHFVISDMQISPGVDTSHFYSISNEIISRLPNVVIFLGDFWDMKSMFKITKETFDGKKYKDDIKAGKDAMEELMRPIINFINSKNNITNWKPRFIFTLGNHEDRITKMELNYKALGGLMGIDDLELSRYGFEVIPFLTPVIIDGIAYCHYFTSGGMNNAICSARQLILKKLMNCVQGHRQSFEIHREVKADGTPIYGIFAGSSYIHNEEYLKEQGNHYARLVWAMNDIKKDVFDPEQLLISRLVKKWGVK